MKIFDIINEGPLPAITNPDEISDYQDLAYRRHPVNPGISYVGRGADATVFKTDEHPEVLKIMAVGQYLQNNPYLQYVLMSKRHAHENPFLPRIISIQTAPNFDKQNRQGMVKTAAMYVVKMEPLVDMGVLTKEERGVMYEHAFGVGSSFTSADDFARDIEEALRGHHNIKNKHLLAVLRLIVKIQKQVPDSYFDMHGGNIMARRTPYGPQLVIIDPLHSDRDDINR